MRALLFPFVCTSLLACGLAACGKWEDDDGSEQGTSSGGDASAGGASAGGASPGGTSGDGGDQQATSSGGTNGTDGWTLKSAEEIEAQFPCDDGSQRVGDVELRSLADIEAFAGVSHLEGTLLITAAASDLRALHCLRTIALDLRIYDAMGLRDLAGLEGLTAVDGAIQVGLQCDGSRKNCSGNRDLESLSLPGLERAGVVAVGASCGGEGGPYCEPNSALKFVQMNRLEEISRLTIAGNPVLEEVRFESIAELTSLAITNPVLHTLSLPQLHTAESLAINGLTTVSLPQLRTVEDLSLSGGVEQVIAPDLEATGSIILGNTQLEDLSWLNAQSAVEIKINGNPELRSLRGLERLEEVDRLFLDGNPALTTLEGLEGLRAIHDLLLITNMSALESLTGLDALETVGEFILEANDLLPDLTGLTSLTHLPDLKVQNNPSLVSLQGMDALESIGELSLRSNAVLASVEGARTLEVQERLDVYESPMLRSLQGLVGSPELISLRLSRTSLEDVEIMSGVSQIGSVEIDYLDRLESLSGMEALTTIGSLSLMGNQFLTDLSALGSLQSVQGELSIRTSPRLFSLAGLESVTQAGQLYIKGNAQLSSVDALASLTSVEFGFQIEDNPSLPTCAAEALVEQTDHNPSLVTIRGNDDAGVCNP